MSSPEPLELELLGVPVRLEAGDEELRARLALCYGRSRSVPATKALGARIAQADAGYRIAVDTRAERFEADPTAAVRVLNHELLQALMLRCRAHYSLALDPAVQRRQHAPAGAVPPRH